MKPLLLPLAGLLLGGAAGAGAAFVLDRDGGGAPGRAPPAEPASPAGPGMAAPAAAADPSGDTDQADLGYVDLGNQFIVPVVKDGAVDALVVLSLSVEVPAKARDDVFAHEPKLRDALLDALFDHGSVGGFAGDFTGPSSREALRRVLTQAARDVLGDRISAVLITGIVRQDVG